MSPGAVVLKGPRGWTLELDPAEVIPEDPGAGTPAMLYGPRREWATYWAALNTGETGDGETIPAPVYDWLESGQVLAEMAARGIE